MSHVRCKFRCMTITQHISKWSVRFLVVTEKGDDENHLFWRYTPSGELELETPGRPEFVVNETYYIDLERLGEGRPDWQDPEIWVCSKVEAHSKVSVVYEIDRKIGTWNGAPPPHQASLRFQVDNPAAIESMRGCIDEMFRVRLGPADDDVPVGEPQRPVC